MATNYVMQGKVLPFTNGTGSPIASGQVVVVGAMLAVALDAIAAGAVGQVQVGEVFRCPKATDAVIAQGESMVWDVSEGSFDDNQATPATGDVSGSCAVAAAAAGNGDTEVDVLFTGVPGTVTA